MNDFYDTATDRQYVHVSRAQGRPDDAISINPGNGKGLGGEHLSQLPRFTGEEPCAYEPPAGGDVGECFHRDQRVARYTRRKGRSSNTEPSLVRQSPKEAWRVAPAERCAEFPVGHLMTSGVPIRPFAVASRQPIRRLKNEGQPGALAVIGPESSVYRDDRSKSGERVEAPHSYHTTKGDSHSGEVCARTNPIGCGQTCKRSGSGSLQQCAVRYAKAGVASHGQPGTAIPASFHGPVAQRTEHRNSTPTCVRSNRTGASTLWRRSSMAEQAPYKGSMASSILPAATTHSRRSA